MKKLLVDKNISTYSVQFLKSLGFTLIFTTKLFSIDNSTSTHPDMQFVKIGRKKAIVALQSLDYYKKNLPDYDFLSFDDIKSPYPNDTLLNFVLLNNISICTEYQFDRIDLLKNYKCLYVKQGYTKCNICISNDNAILTSDLGIIKSLKNSGIEAFYLPDSQIKLDGYKNGFWGGATGLIDKNKLFFNGNIENLDCYNQLLSVLEQLKIEPLYHTKTELYDVGSIILLD